MQSPLKTCRPSGRTLLQVAGIHISVHLVELLYFSIKARMVLIRYLYIIIVVFHNPHCSIHHSCVQWCHDMSWLSNCRSEFLSYQTTTQYAYEYWLFSLSVRTPQIFVYKQLTCVYHKWLHCVGICLHVVCGALQGVHDTTEVMVQTIKLLIIMCP